MITNSTELKEYLSADRSRYKLRYPLLLSRILHDEGYVQYRYLKCLRRLEYYMNRKSKNGLKNLMYIWYTLKHRRLSQKYNILIGPNTVGKGLYMPHIVGGVIINALRVGDYCIVNSGVIIGKKGLEDNKPIIGDRVEITIGAKIFGKCVIGDDAAIAPNSVVFMDVPSNAIVSGVPAKIIKIK